MFVFIIDGTVLISIHGDGSSISDISSLHNDTPKILLPNQQCIVDVLTIARAKNINPDNLNKEGSDLLKELVEKHVQWMIRVNKLPKDYDSTILYADVVKCLQMQDQKVKYTIITSYFIFIPRNYDQQ